jgi:hypothetical protein
MTAGRKAVKGYNDRFFQLRDVSCTRHALRLGLEVSVTDKCIIKANLKLRGWTDSLIKRFLPKADKLATNPHYKSGPPMRLYYVARVEAIEASPEFIAQKEQLSPRREAAARAVATKRAKMDAYLEEIEITVPELGRDSLIDQACKHYNAKNWDRDNCASSSSDPEFLDRICVNYLRHVLTEYEARLNEISGQVGAAEAYCDIKEEALWAIADAYPFLAAECRRQTSALSQRNFGIDWLEFATGVVDLHLLINAALSFVDIVWPGANLSSKRFQIADSIPPNALRCHWTQFILGNVQPTSMLGCVAEFNAANKLARFPSR